MYEAALTSSGPSPPSSNTSSCGEMAEYHVSGVTEAGGAETRLLAILRASWVMFAPRIWGTAASETFTVPEGWTAKTNSSVARTPSGRSGTRVSFSISLERSHGGTPPGRTRRLRAPRTLRVFVLKLPVRPEQHSMGRLAALASGSDHRSPEQPAPSGSRAQPGRRLCCRLRLWTLSASGGRSFPFLPPFAPWCCFGVASK